jgi:hypothetical protein
MKPSLGAGSGDIKGKKRKRKGKKYIRARGKRIGDEEDRRQMNHMRLVSEDRKSHLHRSGSLKLRSILLSFLIPNFTKI